MRPSPAASLALNKVASLLVGYLPNTPHPYADQRISIAGVARDLGLVRFHGAGSKLVALVALLSGTLKEQPDQFCPLIVEIVTRGLTYRQNKGSPICGEDIEELNTAVSKVGFKIPELWDTAFLSILPSRRPPAAPPSVAPSHPSGLGDLRTSLVQIGTLPSSQRGSAFEKLLNRLFEISALEPHRPFRLTGEQLDGSFDLDGDNYLLEAKFHAEPIGPSFLREFRDKVGAKASWARGLFVSWSGITEEALAAFRSGHRTNTIGMSGQDLFWVLDGRVDLPAAIRLKARRAAETGEFYVPLQELLPGR